MSLEEQGLVTITVNGRDLGVFETISAYTTDSTTVTTRLGPLEDVVTLATKGTLGEFTVGRTRILERDTPLMKWTHAQVSQPCTVSIHPVDRNRQPYGDPDVIRTTLKSVTSPPVDVNSEAKATWSLTFNAGGKLG
jgi:hypothetical protein